MFYFVSLLESMKRKNINANSSSFLIIIHFILLFLFNIHGLAFASTDKLTYSVIPNCNSTTALPSEVKAWIPDMEFNSKFTTAFIDSSEATAYPQSAKLFVAIFQTEFNYTTYVCPGTKFIRLHFYPCSYLGLDISKAQFSVSLGQYTLLRTSASSYSKGASKADYVIKEFSVKVDSKVLNITFTPSRKVGESYAFVNKIEVVSAPSNLYIGENITQLPLIGQQPHNLYIKKSIALETMYRVNVGGHSISAEQDSGMFRAWSEDKMYVDNYEKDTGTLGSKAKINYSSQIPAYTAPEKVYATARTIIIPSGNVTRGSNMSWSFPIEAGFYYLIRLHFCEISAKVSQKNQRAFHIYINDITAEDHADVIQWCGGVDVPVYRDYPVNLSGQGVDYLLIVLQSNTESSIQNSQAILNGMEIFKLSDASNNLAGSNPLRCGARKITSPENQNEPL